MTISALEVPAQRVKLANSYRRLGDVGLNELASGNVSCRTSDGMLISASGAVASSIQAEDLVEMTLEGAVKGGGKPSSEWQMHAAIYKAYTETNAVVHTHSDYCVAVACQLQALPGFHYLVGIFGGRDVPCTPYFTFGTAKLAEAACAALAHRSACLLGSHGMIGRAEDLESAVELAHRLEITARQYVLTRQLGVPNLLTDAQWDEFFVQAENYTYGDPGTS
ncbi:MAG: class II aldolase/adducin family protein [Pseudomonadales bacterium]|nr:class II aldolase/adducin family protein [Pseudomonadales bacterium]